MDPKFGPADSSGKVNLTFIDSGAVEGVANYVTVFVIHGSSFTSRSFDALLPSVSVRGIRLVLVSRRNYAASTPYTDEDLKDMQTGKREWMVNHGREILHFMGWFTKEHNVPRFNTAKQSGGIALMGWSLGGFTLTATLAYPSDIEHAYFDALKPYLRSMIFYDPGFATFGFGLPPQVPPFGDMPQTKEFMDFFAMSASAYYTHTDLTPGNSEGINVAMMGERPSAAAWGPEEMENNFDWKAGIRVEYPIMGPVMQETVRAQTTAALLTEPVAFKDVKMVLIRCNQSHWTCVWGSLELERLQGECEPGTRRPMKMLELDGNHFMHTDRPVEFLDALEMIL